jgi:carboxymethylenebutenolidase
MGGALAIATLANTDLLDAGCPFYGIPDLTKINLSNIKVPVVGHFAENDFAKGFSAPEDAKNLALKA